MYVRVCVKTEYFTKKSPKKKYKFALETVSTVNGNMKTC